MDQTIAQLGIWLCDLLGVVGPHLGCAKCLWALGAEDRFYEFGRPGPDAPHTRVLSQIRDAYVIEKCVTIGWVGVALAFAAAAAMLLAFRRFAIK